MRKTTPSNTLTPLRRAVLSVLIKNRSAMGAYDIQHELAAREKKRIAPMSVYRAVTFLVQSGRAHAIRSINAFVACADAGGCTNATQRRQAAFFICTGCRQVKEINAHKSYQSLQSLAKGFAMEAHGLEVVGLCRRCHRKND